MKKECTIDLDAIYNREEKRLSLVQSEDPLEFVHRYDSREDIEIAGFLASQFAYGRIQSFKSFLENVFSIMTDGPAEFVRTGSFQRLKGLYYRFQSDTDIIRLFRTLRRIQNDFGGLGEMLGSVYRGDVREAIWELRNRLFDDNVTLTFFFPKRSPASPLKRWNLYLRWMVRNDAMDVGIWSFVDKRDLVVPLDTHIFKIGKCLGWTSRSSQSYDAAREITNALKTFCPEDPLKYDFFLCHRIGIDGKCRGDSSATCKRSCLLYEL